MTKLHRNDPWVVPFYSCSKISIPCLILVEVATIDWMKNIAARERGQFSYVNIGILVKETTLANVFVLF